MTASDTAAMVDESEHRRADALVGDEVVFRAVYPALHRLACVVCPPECDPDDLVMDATARVLRRGSLSDLDQPLAYLRRTVVNLASNERRRLGRFRTARARIARSAAEPLAPSYPSDVAVLFELGPEDRAAVWLADVERRPFAEIAEVLGCSTEAARARAARARRRLRELLSDEEDR